ncbi:hypothetical protein NEUTE1DRAFT_135488 [Neurospora tetrasperma FGSC 2508]|uniref:Uncharacterized protein n=1 Tax=Neurospora tetrasperma (strain FGSC 2508 / ATCC MYA-4615 / P0657) TaxID=510951 RepID=F8ME22_NEUT8|nr:uncharacterized protein NEUTE1DRAFT_135488 [Neurospora tetrasperma FGSC 2508]EGO61557.1 hypothetical protein NEUTE1DRAFT_135488 [Neurospora tetrasperma FGSC 2508]
MKSAAFSAASSGPPASSPSSPPLKYPNDKHHNSLSNIKQPRRDTATFANEGPPATYLSLGVGKGRKEAINVIMGKGDRLLVVVERRLCCLNTKDLWTSGRASGNTFPVLRAGQAAQSKSTMEEVEEEHGGIMDKCKMTVSMKKPRA